MRRGRHGRGEEHGKYGNIYAGGWTVFREVAVFEAFRDHRELKPEGIAELNPEGKQLARVSTQKSS